MPDIKQFLIAFLLTVSFGFYSQKSSGQFVNICKRLVKIDSKEYKSKFIKAKKIVKTKNYIKNKGAISIPILDKKLIFKDDYSDENYTTYSVLGVDTQRHWVFVVATFYHDCDVYLINTKTATVDTLLSLPQIYSDKIVCTEQVPDSPGKIQILRIDGDKVIEKQNFKISQCSTSGVRYVYLSKDILYIRDDADGYYKSKTD